MYAPFPRSQNGMATLVALLMVAMLTLLGLAVLSISNDEVRIAGNELQEMRAFYAAEAGLEMAAASMLREWENTGMPPTNLPVGVQTMNDCEIHYLTRDGGAPTRKRLSKGSLAGLWALVKTYRIESVATSSIDHGRILMTQDLESALIPIFQFGVFYENDLEIAPGPPMTLSGRVHTNADIYLQSGNGLLVQDFISSSRRILYGSKVGATSTGDVQINNPQNKAVTMKMESGWLDHSSPSWYDSSIARWGDRVQDMSHGQPDLNVPIEGGGSPHRMIEPGAGNVDSYEHKATLKIVDGVAYEHDGANWVDVTADLVTKGIVTYAADRFYDARESEWVDVTELDVGALYSQGYDPTNGVIYFSDDIASSTDYPALRLVNAELLGGSLTVASNNPIYTLGNFNSTDKKPAALMADAVTFLSGAWNDSRSSGSKGSRIATTTTVNAAYVTGNVESAGTDYSGGLENLPRFLESWSGTSLNWMGSAVCLWESVQATGLWDGSYYSPPNRNWSFDEDFDDPDKLPPMVPAVRFFQRTGWEQLFVGFEPDTSETPATEPL